MIQRIAVPRQRSTAERTSSPGLIHSFSDPVATAAISTRCSSFVEGSAEPIGRPTIAIAIEFVKDELHIEVVHLVESGRWHWTDEHPPSVQWISLEAMDSSERVSPEFTASSEAKIADLLLHRDAGVCFRSTALEHISRSLQWPKGNLDM
jgi:hypothetical protein